MDEATNGRPPANPPRAATMCLLRNASGRPACAASAKLTLTACHTGASRDVASTEQHFLDRRGGGPGCMDMRTAEPYCSCSQRDSGSARMWFTRHGSRRGSRRGFGTESCTIILTTNVDGDNCPLVFHEVFGTRKRVGRCRPPFPPLFVGPSAHKSWLCFAGVDRHRRVPKRRDGKRSSWEGPFQKRLVPLALLKGSSGQERTRRT